jgi:hypothetical protein
MKNITKSLFLLAILVIFNCTSKKSDTSVALAALALSNSASTTTTTNLSCTDNPYSSQSFPVSCTTNIASDVPSWMGCNFACVTMTKSGTNVVITTDSKPNYKSYYYGPGTTCTNCDVKPEYTAGTNYIIAQNNIFTIPIRTSDVATANVTTSMGPIGVAYNGVVLYNNQAAPGDYLTNEVDTFDTGKGHPTNTGSYHYHIQPTKYTTTTSFQDTGLIGIALDGYPVFGKKCPADNVAFTSTDDTTAHGHSKDTKITGLGTIWHYHATSGYTDYDRATNAIQEVSYFLGAYHYGSKGTVK